MKDERKPDNPTEGMTEDEKKQRRTMGSGKHHI